MARIFRFALPLGLLLLTPVRPFADEGIVLPGLAGGQLTAADLERETTILVVWASWSPRCRDVARRIEALESVWSGRARVASVVFQEGPSGRKRSPQAGCAFVACADPGDRTEPVPACWHDGAGSGATSFVPNQDVCGYGGDARLYAIDYLYGVVEDGVLTEMQSSNRYIDIGLGIPSEPVFYFDPKTKEASVIVQKSDSKIINMQAILEERPMLINSWRAR